MKSITPLYKPLALAVGLALASSTAVAGDDLESLRQTVAQLQKQLAEVQKKLEEQEKQAATTHEEVKKVAEVAASADEWKAPSTLVHMAGYADVGYVSSEGSDGSFIVGTFAPIFHFQYRDLVMLESELEVEVEPDGTAEVGLEYLTVDWFVNDYMAVVAGRFLSPLGQFRQNLHPSWINKIASAPPGFGHDGAAPTSETGVQLRGGFPLGAMRANYAVYVGNGPELNAATEDMENFELEGVRAEGFGNDRDGNKVFGGRFGLLPMPGLELGISAATGKARVTALEIEAAGGDEGKNEPGEAGGFDYFDEADRDYSVYGFDFNFSYRSLNIRGEYVNTEVGEATTGLTASEGASWSSWYTQASWRFLPGKWEAVARYSDFDAAVNSRDQKQWALGLNYLYTSNFMAKFSYEFNDGMAGSEADEDRLLMQLAYGF